MPIYSLITCRQEFLGRCGGGGGGDIYAEFLDWVIQIGIVCLN